MSTRIRSFASVLVGLVAVVGLLMSVVAVWAHDVFFDSEEVATAAESALAEPDVTAALATRITDLAFDAADVEERMRELMPLELHALVPALVGGAHTTVSDRLELILGEEDTRAILVAMVERGHAGIMKLFAGEGLVEGEPVSEGEVRLNLLPFVEIGLQNVQALGYLPGREIPTFTPDGDPADQIAALEAAFGRDLPDDFGQLSVYRSDMLAEASTTVSTAQRVLLLAKRALFALLAVTLLGFAACVVLAPRRRRAVLALALASVAAMMIARAVVRTVLVEAPTVARDSAGRSALKASLDSLAADLLVLITLTVALSVAVAIGAYLRGDNRGAAQLRGKEGSAALAIAVAIIAFGGFGTGRVLLAIAFAVIGAWATWSSSATGRAADDSR